MWDIRRIRRGASITAAHPMDVLHVIHQFPPESRGGSDHYLRIWVDDEGKSLHISGRHDRWNYCDFVWALAPALL